MSSASPLNSSQNDRAVKNRFDWPFLHGPGASESGATKVAIGSCDQMLEADCPQWRNLKQHLKDYFDGLQPATLFFLILTHFTAVCFRRITTSDNYEHRLSPFLHHARRSAIIHHQGRQLLNNIKPCGKIEIGSTKTTNQPTNITRMY